MSPLLEKAGVVDLPGLDWLPRAQCLDGISRGTTAHLAIAPRRVGGEVLQLLMDSAHLLVIGAAACSDRLDALSLPLAQQPQRVGREGRSPALMPEDLAGAAGVLRYPNLRAPVEECLHAQESS